MKVRGQSVWVLPVKGRAPDVEALRQNLAAMGATVVCPDEIELRDWEKCLAAATVVVVPLCTESLGDKDIKAVVVSASREGKRIIGIWLDEVETEIPVWIEREGNAVVVSTPEDIQDVVIEGKDVWQTSKRKTRPKQPTPRHKGH